MSKTKLIRTSNVLVHGGKVNIPVDGEVKVNEEGIAEVSKEAFDEIAGTGNWIAVEADDAGKDDEGLSEEEKQKKADKAEFRTTLMKTTTVDLEAMAKLPEGLNMSDEDLKGVNRMTLIKMLVDKTYE